MHHCWDWYSLNKAYARGSTKGGRLSTCLKEKAIFDQVKKYYKHYHSFTNRYVALHCVRSLYGLCHLELYLAQTIGSKVTVMLSGGFCKGVLLIGEDLLPIRLTFQFIKSSCPGKAVQGMPWGFMFHVKVLALLVNCEHLVLLTENHFITHLAL